MSLELASVIDHFTTLYCYTPSTLGHQLDGLRLEGEHMPQLESDPLGRIESSLAQAEVFRCVDYLREQGPPVDGKWGRVYPALAKARDASRASGKHLKMGALICALLHDYQEFGTRDPVRGLRMVAQRLHSINPTVYPLESEKTTLCAKECYADAFLALDATIKQFNNNAKKKNTL